MSNLDYKEVTIPSGSSTSEALNLEGKECISITMSGTLTGTTLSIQVSDSTTGTFTNQYVNGDQRSYTTAANYTHQFNPPIVAGAIKFDTGASEGADRTPLVGIRQFQ